MFDSSLVKQVIETRHTNDEKFKIISYESDDQKRAIIERLYINKT